MDTLTADQRSKNMRAIRSKDTKPELIVRKLLFSNGYRYRLHSRRLPGRPDIVLKKHNAVIFINGCFWHRHKGCPYAVLPKSHADFWNQKLSRNATRDAAEHQTLLGMGWRILVVWECALKTQKTRAISEPLILEWLAGREQYREISGPLSDDS